MGLNGMNRRQGIGVEGVSCRDRLRCRIGMSLLLWTAAAQVEAAGGAAGLIISNTASVTFDVLGVPGSADSNTDAFAVVEVLDLALVRNDAGSINVTTPGAGVPQSYTLTNTGNGPEAFVLQANQALAGDDFDPQNVRIYLDNGDGIFNISTDTLYVSGVNDPSLLPDASRVLFVVSDIPANRVDGDIGLVSLQATAVTGSGTPGTLFPGAGSAGVDAVVGATTANDSEQNGYLVAQISTALVKSQVVRDVAGGALVISGSTITYTLVFTVTGTGTLLNTALQDAIPAGTTYLPGSLTLDSAPLTDATDSDAGRFTGTQIEVVPGVAGALTAPGTATVTFQVTIN